jgi:hypothetical protein
VSLVCFHLYSLLSHSHIYYRVNCKLFDSLLTNTFVLPIHHRLIFRTTMQKKNPFFFFTCSYIVPYIYKYKIRYTRLFFRLLDATGLVSYINAQKKKKKKRKGPVGSNDPPDSFTPPHKLTEFPVRICKVGHSGESGPKLKTSSIACFMHKLKPH